MKYLLTTREMSIMSGEEVQFILLNKSSHHMVCWSHVMRHNLLLSLSWCVGATSMIWVIGCLIFYWLSVSTENVATVASTFKFSYIYRYDFPSKSNLSQWKPTAFQILSTNLCDDSFKPVFDFGMNEFEPIRLYMWFFTGRGSFIWFVTRWQGKLWFVIKRWSLHLQNVRVANWAWQPVQVFKLLTVLCSVTATSPTCCVSGW